MRMIIRGLTWSVLTVLFYGNTLTGQPAVLGSDIPLPTVDGRDRLLSPPNDGGPVEVRAAFHLQNINDIDEQTETFEFTGVLTLTWRDPRQAFSPEEEGVQEKVYQ